MGVIREDNNNRKLIFMIEDYKSSTIDNSLKIRLFAQKEILRKYHNSEIWDIEIDVFKTGKYKYIIHEINTEIKNRVDTVKIVLINQSQKAISDTIKFNNLYLNND